MEKFVVSARKYRPQNFSTVVGQSHITTTLKNAINHNQLAHAFLFCGPRGVGKTSCARILAKTINCETKTPEGEACNVCNSCVSFDNGTSLNIHELDAASNNSVDDIRSLVEQVRFAPQAGEYKVYIVDEVHMLSSAAFNAFLKTLEEPPPYAIFILATTEKHKILPTILSRCQIFDFKRITNKDSVEHLQEICDKEKITAETAALHVIAQKSEGCMRDALSIMDKIASFTDGQITYANTLEHLNILDEDYYFSLLDFMRTQKLSDSLLLYDKINEKGFDGDTLLEGLSEFIRNLLVSKDKKAVALLEVAEDFKEKYVKVASELSLNWLIAALNILSEAGINYKLARNKKLFVELVLIKLSYLTQAIELEATPTDGLSKKKVTANSKAMAFRSLPIIKAPENKIVTELAPKVMVKKEEAVPTLNEPAATLVIQSQKPTVEKMQEAQKTTKSFGSLTSIREKIKQQNGTSSASKALTIEALQEAWEQFIDKLKDQKNNTSVSNFQAAELSIVDENSFDISVHSSFMLRFIESEKMELTDHLQKYFNNRLLKYQIIVNERVEDFKGDEEVHLSQKDQYQILIDQFPLVKTLKETLKLDIGF